MAMLSRVGMTAVGFAALLAPVGCTYRSDVIDKTDTLDGVQAIQVPADAAAEQSPEAGEPRPEAGQPVWMPSVGTWRRATDSGMAPRGNPVAYPVGGKALFYGGSCPFSPNSPPQTGAIFDPATDQWTRIADGPTYGENGGRERLFAASGTDLLLPLASAPPLGWDGALWMYDLQSDVWRQSGAQMSSGSCDGRVAWAGDRLVYFLGDYSLPHDYGYVYDPVSDVILPVGTPPSALRGANGAFVSIGARVFVWSVVDYDYNLIQNGWLYDPIADTWTSINIDGAPSPRMHPVAVWTGLKVILYGGKSASGSILNDGAIYDPATNTWAAMSNIGAPTPQFASERPEVDTGGVWADGRLIVWIQSPIPSGGIYDPDADTWAKISTEGAPQGRYPGLVWTGSELVVYGDATCQDNAAYVYEPPSRE